MSPKTVTVEAGPDAHDDVVLLAAEKADHICAWAFSKLGVKLPEDYVVEYEHEIGGANNHWNDGNVHVDIGLLAIGDDPVLRAPFLLLEVKSEREKQSASLWFRQIRQYRRLAKCPCILVTNYEVGPVQRRYLTRTQVPWLDLRTL